jgi:putative ABC transport system ATP-binding protein
MSKQWVGPVVSLRDLTRVHGSGAAEVRALVGVSLDVAAGELVAVMGPSGSGKSTLLSLTGGLDSPTAGNVVVEGVHLSELSRRQLAQLRRTRIGYVFQDYNLIPALTAAENVALPLELDGMRAGRARRMAGEALVEVGLDGLDARFPEELSGGQRQRTAIARALIGERRLVLADEPTGALDSQTSEAVLRVLRKRCDAGAAGILVTHEPRYAAYADRTIFLRDGRIVDATGAPASAIIASSATAVPSPSAGAGFDASGATALAAGEGTR